VSQSAIFAVLKEVAYTVATLN